MQITSIQLAMILSPFGVNRVETPRVMKLNVMKRLLVIPTYTLSLHATYSKLCPQARPFAAIRWH